MCDCGNKKVVDMHSLKTGNTKSCGCLRGESHGLSKSKLHTVWRNIKARCNNPNHPEFKHYGGKGVRLCDEWNSFTNFKDWSFSHGYAENLTLDRINNDGIYCPSNCRWADRKTQQRNRSNNVLYNGKTVPELSEMCGIRVGTIYGRLRKGWSIEKATSTPARPRKSGTVPLA